MIRLHNVLPATSDDHVFLPPPQETPHVRRQLDDLIAEVAEVIAPVWPLKDYVAVNPYLGVSERSFLNARSFLRVFSDCESLMPLSFYQARFSREDFDAKHIATALEELQMEESLSVAKLVSAMSESTESGDPVNRNRVVFTIAEHAERYSKLPWSEIITEEVSKFCSAHYDEGQAVWSSPWRELPAFQAWRSAAEVDRNLESLGLKGFRKFVSKLPHAADAAIVTLLQELEVPRTLWKTVLLCQACSIPGWSAWAKFKTDWAGDGTEETTDFVSLLAIRLAYDVALSKALGIQVDWNSVCQNQSASFDAKMDNEAAFRFVLQRASEIALRDRLLREIATDEGDPVAAERKSAQVVFCIDVRSERIRRHLESQAGGIETFGFAGFFGMPIERVPMGASHGDAHVPVLIKPGFRVYEGLQESVSASEIEATGRRLSVQRWRKLWKDFQSSAAGCFSFIETTGLAFVWKLWAGEVSLETKRNSRQDGLSVSEQKQLRPTLRELDQQGFSASQQVELAASMLTSLGLTMNFARLVMFCGHAGQTENNPLAASLDCGACGGHSGEPNARFAASLLNQSYIRDGLNERGIEIPDDTHFLAGLHNTTTDEIELFDLENVPATHFDDAQELLQHTRLATKETRLERMPTVQSHSDEEMLRRAADWSEVRPEWGLAGNAAFVAAPRAMTRHADLQGRVFLHNYDHGQDPDGAILESIMTAPMVVAHWINMQYYASTVDPKRFGSGSKTIHNVVGRFGILSGNGGDLKTGLPWQSVHDGQNYQHVPLRLQSVIAAPRDAIDLVVQKHEHIANLLNNGWLHLIAVENGVYFRYSDGAWVAVDSDSLVGAVS